MSDNIPFDIQYEIMKRLPIKPLIQFRSVSKAWKSLIDSTKFIANYHSRKTQPQHLLVSYALTRAEQKYVSIADDDTFPQGLVCFCPLTLPVLEYIHPTIVTSQGLVCLFWGIIDVDHSEYKEAVIWNPTIRKSVLIVVRHYKDPSYKTVVAFGVCPKTCVPKLVKVAFTCISVDSGPIAEVFSLGARVWRRLAVNLPGNSIAFTENNVAIHRFIYWLAFTYQRVTVDTVRYLDVIVSFDMTSEEFMKICLPDSLALDLESQLSLSKLGESLVVVQKKIEAGKEIYSVWEMEDGVPKLFKKLFTIKTPDEFKNVNVLGFRKSGEVITVMRNDLEEDALFVYNTNSGKSTYIGITGKPYTTFSVSSYMETLLLLDH